MKKMPDFGKIQVILGINDLFRDNKILAVENLRLQTLLLKFNEICCNTFLPFLLKKDKTCLKARRQHCFFNCYIGV